jgi:hypothetical protein
MMRHLLLLLGTPPFRRSLPLLQPWVGDYMDGCEEQIEEEVYIEQPNGFVIHGKESHVCRLKKALYGLKQAPRAWYARIDGYLMIWVSECC